ncbi:Hint domain-containing protein [Pseudoxanthobacter sp. M-2]|uniref:Hint domain-containing protein n=1 Tax=Pseudoxanthobacter sp. M-2 TaxID=3078754 RepID=UPI0038FC627B
MATYEALYLWNVTLNEGTQTVTAWNGRFDVQTSSSGDFSVGDTIVVTDLSNSNTYNFVYLGHLDGGWIGVLGGSTYRYITNDATVPSAPIVYSTADFVVCFLAGTRIATPGGSAAIESLEIGDLVLTADGRVAPVRFVGRQTVASTFADPLRTFPIRISAGALGEGLPTHDLLVSPDHALLLEGVLVQAGALVNDTTIVRETAMPERFTYFHVELEDHSLILAEGVPAETFVDNVTRRRFDNFADYAVRYGDEAATIAEMDQPRVKSARQLPKALRARLGLDVARAA